MLWALHGAQREVPMPVSGVSAEGHFGPCLSRQGYLLVPFGHDEGVYKLGTPYALYEVIHLWQGVGVEI